MNRALALRYLAAARRASRTAPPPSTLEVEATLGGRATARWWGIEVSARTEAQALCRLIDRVADRLDRGAREAQRRMFKEAREQLRQSNAASVIRRRAIRPRGL